MTLSKKKKPDWARRAFYGALIASVAWGFLIEPRFFFKREHVALLPHLPAGCEGVKIAVVGDWHIGSQYSSPFRARERAQEVAAVHPDLILLPGDFLAHGIGMHTLPMRAMTPSLAPLSAQAPTYAVLGNHDHVNSTPIMISEPLYEVGIHTLFNASEQVHLREGKCSLRVIGFADDFTGVSAPRQALAQVQPGETKIGFTHSPTLYPKVQSRVDVLFAGHSHGGVACVPGTTWCLSRFSAWGSKWVKGVYQPPGYHAPLLINSGVGNSIMPLRFSSAPGYDIITLRSTHKATPSISP